MMLSWVEIAVKPSKERFDLLSKKMTDLGIENQVEYLNPDIDSLEDCIEDAKQRYGQIRVSSPFCEIVGQNMELTTALTLSIKSVDCLHFDGEHWWPRSCLEEGFTRMLTSENINVDIHSKALIIGAGAAARAMILPINKLGYKSISFTDKFTERGEELIADLKKKFFNLNISFIPQEEIAQLPGAYSFAVNTTPDIESNDLIEDLCYFNYLKPESVIVDLNINTKESSFVEQARAAEAKLIAGYAVASWVDSVWVELCFAKKLDIIAHKEDYKKILLSHEI